MIIIHDKRYKEYQYYAQRLIDNGEIGIETNKAPKAKAGQELRRERRKLNRKNK